MAIDQVKRCAGPNVRTTCVQLTLTSRLFVTSSNTVCFIHGRRGEFSHCRRRTLVRVCSGLRLANPTWYAHHQHVHQQLSLLQKFDTGANTTEIDTGSSKCVGFDPSSLRPGTRELASTQDLEGLDLCLRLSRSPTDSRTSAAACSCRARRWCPCCSATARPPGSGW